MNEQQSNNAAVTAECARYFAEAAGLIRKARSLVQYKPKLSSTLEGYDRHLSRLAARFGCVPLRITLAVWPGCDTYTNCSQCDEAHPDSENAVILRRNRAQLFVLDADAELLPVCLNCAERIAPELYAEWGAISERELEYEQNARAGLSLVPKPFAVVAVEDKDDIPF